MGRHSDEGSEIEYGEKNDVDAGQAYEYDPNFNGIEEGRKCTDCCCTILFILFICGMFALFFIALTRSNYKYLYIPTDTRGQMCGYDNSKIKPDLSQYEFSNGTGEAIDKEKWNPFLDLSNQPYLFWVRPGKHGYSRSFCVKECPNEGKFIDTFNQLLPKETTTEPVDGNYIYGAEETDTTVCAKGGIKPSIENYSIPSMPGIDKESDLYKKRFFCPYKSFLLASRCFPTAESLQSGEGESTINMTTLGQNLTDALDSVSAVADAVHDIYITVKWIAISIVIALGLSIVYLLLLRLIAGFMVYLTVLLAAAGLGVLTYMCYKQRNNEFGNMQKAEGYTLGLYSQKLNKNVFTAFFWILVVLDVIYILLIIFLCERIRLSVGILKCVSKIFGHVPQLFFFPIIIYVLQFIWCIYVVGVAVVLFGAGSPFRVYDRTYLVDRLEYRYDTLIQGFAIYHFVGFLWILFFISALGEMTIAGVCADYYFSPEPRKDNMHKHPVSSSFFRSLRYHTGSLACGSFIITIMTIIRIMIEYADQKTKQSQSAVAKAAIKCLKCCFYCLDKFLKYLNRNCYIMIAIHGYNFWNGCKQAFNLLLRNIVRVTTLNFVGDFVLFLGRVFVCGAVTAIALYFFSHKVDGITFPILPSLLVFVISLMASGAFTNVFEMGIDSTLLCFLEDEERNDGSPGHEKKAPQELVDFIKK